MSGNPGGLSDGICLLWLPAQSDGFPYPAAGMPGSAGSVSSAAGMPGAAGSVRSAAGMSGAAGSVRRLIVAKSSNRRFCHTVFEKIFDRDRSVLMLIP